MDEKNRNPKSGCRDCEGTGDCGICVGFGCASCADTGNCTRCNSGAGQTEA